jgi:hypothetical protein
MIPKNLLKINILQKNISSILFNSKCYSTISLQTNLIKRALLYIPGKFVSANTSTFEINLFS